MKRSRDLVLEALECKQLPSTVTPISWISPPAIDTSSQGLAVKLSTAHQVYKEGEPVVITLTETNTSQHDITVEQGPSIGGIEVSHNSREIWASNSGVQPMFIMLRTLAPGQSITQTTTWNGQSNIGPAWTATGRLVIGSQIAGVQPISIQIRPH